MPWLQTSYGNTRGKDVPFNLFTLMELHYTTGLNTKGLLKANDDKTVAYAKPAYSASQNVFAIFDHSLGRMVDFQLTASVTNALAVYAATHPSGARVVALWFKGAPPSDSNQQP